MPQLCAISSENYKCLGLNHVQVVCSDGVGYLHQMEHADLIFIDPARRDQHGARTYGIADCTPNVLELIDEMLEKARGLYPDIVFINLDANGDLHEINEKFDMVFSTGRKLWPMLVM